jgi:Skp family chaperone for outer membrane proteins
MTLLAAAASAGNLWAQATPMVGREASSATTATKIGLVNLGVLFRDQDKVKEFRARLDVKVKPYDAKAKELEDHITQWSKVLQDDKDEKLPPEKREKCFEQILEARRRLQDLEKECHESFGCELGAELVNLDKEIRQAIRIYAEEHGYQLILAFGEPDVPLPPLKEMARRMTAIDAGNVALVPLDGPNHLDVTRGVLDLLNTSYRATQRR